jgi:phosphonate transport system substrate-binding protein
MASGKVSDATLKAVATAFFNMKNDPKGREILHEASAKAGMDKDAYFIPADDRDYASYKRFYQTAPASLK